MPPLTFHFFVAKYSQLLAYGVVVVLACVAIWQVQSQQNQLETEIEARTQLRNEQALRLCEEARVNREALRNQIRSIAQLGISLSTGTDDQSRIARERFRTYELTELQKIPTFTCPRQGDVVPQPSKPPIE